MTEFAHNPSPEAKEQLTMYKSMEAVKARLLVKTVLGNDAYNPNKQDIQLTDVQKQQLVDNPQIGYEDVQKVSQAERVEEWQKRGITDRAQQMNAWEQNFATNMAKGDRLNFLKDMFGEHFAQTQIRNLYSDFVYDTNPVDTIPAEARPRSPEVFVNAMMQKYTESPALQDKMNEIAWFAKQLYGSKVGGEIVAQIIDLKNQLKTPAGKTNVKAHLTFEGKINNPPAQEKTTLQEMSRLLGITHATAPGETEAARLAREQAEQERILREGQEREALKKQKAEQDKRDAEETIQKIQASPEGAKFEKMIKDFYTNTMNLDPRDPQSAQKKNELIQKFNLESEILFEDLSAKLFGAPTDENKRKIHLAVGLRGDQIHEEAKRLKKEQEEKKRIDTMQQTQGTQAVITELQNQGVTTKLYEEEANKHLLTTRAVTEKLLPPPENINQAEAEKVMQDVEFTGDKLIGPGGKGFELTKDILKNAQLQPKHKVTLDNGVIAYLSQPYDIGDGRAAVIGYVQDGDRTVARSFYRSNSQGIWRYLPFHAYTWYGKGWGQDSINLPIELQKTLADLTVDTNAVIKIPNAEQIFLGTAKINRGSLDRKLSEINALKQSVDFGKSDPALKNQIQELERALNEKKTELERISIANVVPVGKKLQGEFYINRGKVPPEQMKFTDPQEAPDFSRVVATWTQNTTLYGDVILEVFESANKKKYIFMRDKKGRACIAAVDNGGTMTGMGIRKEWINPGDLSTPIVEYPGEDGGYGGQDEGNNYVDMWQNYLSKVPVIRDYISSVAQRSATA